jgi:DNA-binding SARP family transcriptional activator
MSENTVLLLGAPVWEYADSALSIPSQKGRALLWYCAANPGRMFTRSHVAGLLWGTFSDTDSRNSLNTTLTRLRQMLPVVPLRYSGDLIGWDSFSTVGVDLHIFLERTRALDDRMQLRGGPQREQLESALSYWRGTFLEGVELPDAEGYMQWLSAERLNWDRRIVATHARLIPLLESAGSWQLVIDRAHRALSIDPMQERFHRAIMIAYHRLGDRAAALAQFSLLTDLLTAEMGISPDPETIALSEMIAGRHESAPSALAPAPAAPPPPQGAPRESELAFIGRTEPLQAILSRLAAINAHSPAAVLITGDPGIGKSCLSQEAVKRLLEGPGGDQWVLLRGECHYAFRQMPFTPLSEVLSSAWEEVARQDADCAGDFAALSALVPDIQRRCGSYPIETYSVLGAAKALLERLQRPVIIWLEDIESADADTRSLLSYLLHSRPTHPLAILATALGGGLAEEVTVNLRHLERQGRLMWLELDGFDVVSALEICRSFDPSADLHAAIRLHGAAGGNPFIIAETARMLAGRLGGFTATPPLPLSQGVRLLVRDWLGRISTDARVLAQVLSSHPGPIPIDQWQEHSSFDDHRFVAAAEDLLATGMVVEMPSSHEAPDAVDFACSIYRSAVASSLSLTRRITLGRSVVRRLPDQPSPRQP